MKSLRRLLLVPAVAVSVALGTSAVGATTTARLAPPAQLNADGSVSVPVEYTCDVNRTAYVQVALEQQKAQDYAEGGGFFSPLTCSGTRQVVDVIVKSSWGPFDNGRAVAKMTFTSYVSNTWDGFEVVREAGVIRIAR